MTDKELVEKGAAAKGQCYMFRGDRKHYVWRYDHPGDSLLQDGRWQKRPSAVVWLDETITLIPDPLTGEPGPLQLQSTAPVASASNYDSDIATRFSLLELD